jgi:hypothetical protein
MPAPGFNRWDRCFYISGHPPSRIQPKPLAAKCSICARCDFPHRKTREQALLSLSCTQTTRSLTAMTFFPLSLKALAITAIAALAGEQEGDKTKPPLPPPAPHDADDDFEDGDIATPTRDRHGNDDEPL